MEERFIDELADTANTLIGMLGECEINVVEYVTDCVCNNGWVFVDDLEQLDEED